MDSILLVFLSSFLLTVNSHPRNSDLIPKEYYKRQILQPIPGYIPVYIKADGEPIIRSEKVELDSNRVSETGKTKTYAEPKSAQTDAMNTEILIKESKNESPDFSETPQRHSSNEKRKLTQAEEQEKE